MRKVYESWVKDGDSTLALAENIEDTYAREDWFRPTPDCVT